MSEEQNKANPDLVSVFVNFFRAATRPIVTIIFAAVIAQVVVQRIEAPDWFLVMANVVILEWWGERIATHIKAKKGGPNNAQT